MESVAPGVTQLRILRYVNVYFVETGTPGEWVLVDTGFPGREKRLIAAADELFYPGSRPQAILLTHGHLDHRGSARALAGHWRVPIVAHPLEIPYLSGQAQYPPHDPTVGGSLALMSRFLPTQLAGVGEWLQALNPDDPAVPYLPGWRWLHVPGHAPGQLALFREADRTLLGGDAFATCPHDSVPAVLLGIPRISRPGAALNYDWAATRRSVQALAALAPQAIGCGHGPVITGPAAAAGLRHLAAHFPVPAHGRYVPAPARTDTNGVALLPPAPPDALPRRMALVGAGLLAAGAALLLARRGRRQPLPPG